MTSYADGRPNFSWAMAYNADVRPKSSRVMAPYVDRCPNFSRAMRAYVEDVLPFVGPCPTYADRRPYIFGQ